MGKNILKISENCDHLFPPYKAVLKNHQIPSSKSENKNSKLSMKL